MKGENQGPQKERDHVGAAPAAHVQSAIGVITRSLATNPDRGDGGHNA